MNEIIQRAIAGIREGGTDAAMWGDGVLEEIVITVLKAIRKPSDPMINAAVRDVMVDAYDMGCDGRVPVDMFQRMIDEALK